MQVLSISMFDVRSRICGVLLAFAVLLTSAAHAGTAGPILVVGDSLSAAYNIAVDEGWVALLERRLRTTGYGQPVINASVSGETSRGASARLPALLERHRPGIVVIEIGGNDGLRGLPVDVLRANLAGMIEAAQAAKARVLLLGMRIPPNYGPKYTEDFQAVYVELARRYDTGLVPFLLEDVALAPELMQDDGIHPRAPAEPIILDRVWASLEPLLKGAGAGTAKATADAAPVHD
jgi:acyl-CoA thioesterase-1